MTRIELELVRVAANVDQEHGSRPNVAGSIRVGDGERRSFVGWLELLSHLERASDELTT